jgi:hypothetical protein
VGGGSGGRGGGGASALHAALKICLIYHKKLIENDIFMENSSNQKVCRYAFRAFFTFKKYLDSNIHKKMVILV